MDKVKRTKKNEEKTFQSQALDVFPATTLCSRLYLHYVFPFLIVLAFFFFFLLFVDMVGLRRGECVGGVSVNKGMEIQEEGMQQANGTSN